MYKYRHAAVIRLYKSVCIKYLLAQRRIGFIRVHMIIYRKVVLHVLQDADARSLDPYSGLRTLLCQPSTSGS